MEKEHVFDQIPEYLDGHLSKTETAKLEKHLEQCAECQKEVEEMKILFTGFDNEVSAPTDRLRVKFEAALEQEKMQQGKVVRMESRKSSNWAGKPIKNCGKHRPFGSSLSDGQPLSTKKSEPGPCTTAR